MANRRRLSLSWERQSRKQRGRKRKRDRMHTEPLKLTGTCSGEESLVYYAVNILNTFTEQTSATGDVCWIYYVNCWKLKLLKSNCTFLRVRYRLKQRNKHGFCCFDGSTRTNEKNVLTEGSHAPFYIIWLYLNTWKGFLSGAFLSTLNVDPLFTAWFWSWSPYKQLGEWLSVGIHIFFCLNWITGVSGDVLGLFSVLQILSKQTLPTRQK